MANQRVDNAGRGQGQGGFLSQMLRMGLTYIAISSAMSYFKSPAPSSQRNQDFTLLPDDIPISAAEKPSQFQTLMMGVHPDAKLPVFPTLDADGRRLPNHQCIFNKNDFLDFKLFITENYMFDPVSDSDHMVISENGIPYDSSVDLDLKKTINLTVSEHMYQNGSVFAHVFFSKPQSPIDTDDPNYNRDDVIYQRFNLVRYKKKDVVAKTYKLLERVSDGDAPPAEEDSSSDLHGQGETVTPHWVPTLDIALVTDMPPGFGRNAIPAAILQHLQFNGDGNFFPVVYHNDFFLMSKSLIEINSSVVEVSLDISLKKMWFMRWHMQSQMEQQWRQQQEMGTGSEKTTDMIREMLFDTNPILLVITFVVTLFHTLFDFLAFKNDVQFWRKKKSMAGMSVQSLGVNCFFQTVIFLYLLDNDTSYMILISSGIGVLIEYWKLTKAFDVRLGSVREEGTSGPEEAGGVDTDGGGVVLSERKSSRTELTKIGGMSLPVAVSWKLSNDYTSSKTREYDAIATSHLLYVVIPLVFGYSIYSLIHISHKSFYSWVLGSLVGFVYAFGFVLMTPQLFINYKLKSVAHMPWKAMVYKSLNTFIDDLFAFIIKMPLLHRLACFRDDIIFFIYLYQRWIYRVDMSRVNEFGQGGEEDNEGTYGAAGIADDGKDVGTEAAVESVIPSVQEGVSSG